MQTAHTGGKPSTRTPPYTRARQQSKCRDSKKEKNTGPKRVGNAFLKQRLRPIASELITRSDYIEDYNYLTEENYEYLLASAQRYASLLGKKINVDTSGSVGLKIGEIYKALDSMSGDDIKLNIETDGDKLVFVMWDYYGWGDFYFYWIPVSFVEKLNPHLRKIAISFLHQLRATHHLDTTNTSEDVMMISENFWERAQDEREDNPEELLRLHDMYEKEGKVGRLMTRIKNKNYYKRLGPALDKYVPQSGYESKIVALMKKGLDFIGKDKPSILSYSYDPFYDENDDDPRVYPEQMIRLTYDVNNSFEYEMRYWISETSANGYEITQCAKQVLHPDSDKLFEPEKYPTDFYAYLDELLYFLTDNPLWTRMH